MERFTIKQARMLAGYTQEELAKELGISTVTYIKYENKPELMPLGLAKRIAEILKRPIDVFFICE